MLSLGSERVTLPIFDVALIYRQLHFSVIPVFGDGNPEQAKLACVDWKPYQTRLATDAEIDLWFNRRGFQGLAIVTGKVSNLVVLDFDNATLAETFTHRFPDLLHTRIVRSAGRDLPHYYYRLPFNMTLPSRRLQGVDLQSDGRYVIAPPTRIHDKSYRTEKGGLPLTLTPSQVERIQVFLDEIARVQQVARVNSIPQEVSQEKFVTALSPEHAIALYQYHAPLIGRNEALFRVSLQMRDMGYSENDTLRLLTPIHMQTRLEHENMNTRFKEACSTIRSAYSRPARKKVKTIQAGLPTSLREKLLRLELTCVARVLDGLLLHGVPTGALLTEKAICDILEGQVGRYTILNALKARFADNALFFEPINPLPRPHTPTNVALDTPSEKDNKCLLLGVPKPDKNRGRPAKVFRIPEITWLCQKLAVKFTSSDAITPDNLKTVAQYRQAMLRELIKRQPGQYAVGWLANRLSIARRTSQRYIQNSGLNVRPTYETTIISIDTLHHVERERKGQFIEDMFGKRYPCKKEIAHRLLAQGRCPLLLKQTYSRYWHSEGKPLPLEVAEDALETLQNAPQAVSDDAYAKWYINEDKMPYEAQKTPIEQPISHIPPIAQKLSLLPRPKSKRYYRNPLQNWGLEGLANRLYEQIATQNKTAQQDPNYISLALARRLVEEYGAKMVHRVLGVISYRQNIQNYAGFVISWLKSEQRILSYGL